MSNFILDIFAAVFAENDESLLFGIFNLAATSAENANLRRKISDLGNKIDQNDEELIKLKKEKSEILNANAELSSKIRDSSANIDRLTGQNSSLSGKFLKNTILYFELGALKWVRPDSISASVGRGPIMDFFKQI